MNTNCLDGMACPECGQSDVFHVTATSVFMLTEDGTSDHQDVEYDDSAACSCGHCDWAGIIADTKQSLPAANGSLELIAALVGLEPHEEEQDSEDIEPF